MAKCVNCGKKVGCSCKLKPAKDGRRVCLSCLAKINNATSSTTPTAPVVTSVTFKRK